MRESRDRFLQKQNEKISQYAQRYIYPYATRRLEAEDVVFLNYGYEEDPAMQVPLSDSDEPNRYFIQLYHATATQADLSGKRVLEIGCGHGGGASYLTRTLHPASYTGMDLNPSAISFCQNRHRITGLEFRQGDAEELPFADEAFDAVINVESSHLYPHFRRFLDEVTRVLRPNGHFLYTDARAITDIPDWEVELANTPLRTVSQRTISADVVRGMEKSLQQWQYVIDRATPAPLRRLTRNFAPARKACDSLRPGGSSEYRMYSFVKA
ncbi:fatty-acid O-methyltransferase Mtf2 [Mycolicibacterium frederiksbergense]|uniref:fatty-acid O-methyltransferase Mtf2 n=1 Tax=Mycolicibacterium frederiksbergense TaxID=117567 RepID=UPI0024765DBF|nr:class I SAM-dependent methyltransferase [Mycolicibacterium frederiksbergense]